MAWYVSVVTFAFKEADISKNSQWTIECDPFLEQYILLFHNWGLAKPSVMAWGLNRLSFLSQIQFFFFRQHMDTKVFKIVTR